MANKAKRQRRDGAETCQHYRKSTLINEGGNGRFESTACSRETEPSRRSGST